MWQAWSTRRSPRAGASGTRGRRSGEAGDWLAGARREPGSWWPHWSAWMRQHAGRRVRAPQALGSERYPPIEAAPGRYVLENYGS